MNNKTRNMRILVTALLAAMFIASGMLTIVTALDMPFEARAMAGIASAGLAAVALCALAAWSTPGAILAAALAAVLGGSWALANLAGFGAMGEFLALWQGGEADAALALRGGATFMCCAAIALGVIFFLLLYRREFSSLAVMILAAMLVSAHAMSGSASIAATVPGLIAGAAVFALTGGVQRDGSALRVLLPAAVAVAAALALMPSGHVTWKPLEDAANRVRGVFEQYFNFTHERIAFSISEEGYNHGGEINGEAVAMLGGPAQPDERPVLRVTANGSLLLRGTIRGTYTGYSWVDVTPKSRYLYFDVTHRAVRDRVFDLDFESPADAFYPLEAEVELLDAGTSTLFVPGRLERFGMDLSSAVYYNSSGEVFLARDVQPGDAYAVRALLPSYGEGLRQAVIRGETSGDDQYAAILAANSALPAGIEDGVYALTIELTGGAQSSYDKAEAIAGYLRRNMRYRLDVEYPPVGRDFVSWFVLDSKTGYCSYFASAMAVMGRIAGLPTRYVEGFVARPGESGEAILTGQDAHAWAEVYFRGVGWVPFDATNGGAGQGGADGEDDGRQDAGSDAGDGAATGGSQSDEYRDTVPDAPPAPDDGAILDDFDGAPDDDYDQTPERDEDDPPDDPEDAPDALPPDAPEDAPDDAPWEDGADGAPRQARDPRALWIILGILLLILLAALAALWARGRLRQSDPAWLCGRAKRAQQAAMILYRANLTILGHMGQTPVNGETPEAFSARVSEQLGNPDFARFARAVSLSRYGNRPIRREDIEAGLNAYRAFEGGLRRVERLRYAIARVFRGLGSFESIP